MVHLKQPPGGTAAVQVSVKVRVTPVLPPAVRAKLYSKLSSSLPMPGMLRLLLVPTLMLLVADQLTVSCGENRCGLVSSRPGRRRPSGQQGSGAAGQGGQWGGRAVPRWRN